MATSSNKNPCRLQRIICKPSIFFPQCILWTALLKAVQNFWDERNCNIHSMILTVKISLKKVVIMLGNGDECMTWMMPWMNYEQLFPTHIPPQWENCPRSPRSSWPKITSWCKEMHWKNSEDLSPICHKWPVSADIHTLLQFKAEKSQFHINLVNRQHFGTWILLFGLFGQSIALGEKYLFGLWDL